MPTLGVRPQAGRWFDAGDEQPGAEPVAILSHALWQRAFGGAPDTLDQTTMIDGVSVRIVGIMPPGFDVHDQGVELWEPLTIDPATMANSRTSHFLYLVGRLRTGVSLEQARADLDVLLPRWSEISPSGHVPTVDNHRLRIDPLKEDMIGSVRAPLLILQGAVVFVLLIACANLANLLIARADSRLREYAVRTALGASRGRMLRQLVTEGALLALAAGVVGVGLASGGLALLLSVNPEAIPRASEIALDLPVLGFTLVVASLTALIFGLVPMAHVFRERIGPSLRESGNRSTAGSVRARLRSALVVAEVALAVLLVVGAGLLIRSFVNLVQVDVGFDRASLSTFSVVLSPAQYDSGRRVTFFDELTAQVSALPGVNAVAAMSGLPPLRNVNANSTDFQHIPNNRPADDGPAENVD
jgi:predicted permease